jgi:hypothetical protein
MLSFINKILTSKSLLFITHTISISHSQSLKLFVPRPPEKTLVSTKLCDVTRAHSLRYAVAQSHLSTCRRRHYAGPNLFSDVTCYLPASEATLYSFGTRAVSCTLTDTLFVCCGKKGILSPCSQVGAIHPLYLYSAMRDMSLRTSSCGRRASALTSQESYLDRCTRGWTEPAGLPLRRPATCGHSSSHLNYVTWTAISC